MIRKLLVVTFALLAMVAMPMVASAVPGGDDGTSIAVEAPAYPAGAVVVLGTSAQVQGSVPASLEVLPTSSVVTTHAGSAVTTTHAGSAVTTTHAAGMAYTGINRSGLILASVAGLLALLIGVGLVWLTATRRKVSGSHR